MRIYEISPAKPLDPQAARIKALADATARARKAEKLARARDHLAKAQKSLSKAQATP